MPTEERWEKVVRELAAKHTTCHVTIVDEAGKVPGTLKVDKDGATLYVSDAANTIRAKLTVVGKEAPFLNLYDEKGTHCAMLVVHENGPFMNLDDKKGKFRVGLNLGNDRPWPLLTLYDEAETLRVALSVDKDGADLARGEEGKGAAGLRVGKDGPWLRLYDEKGNPIWSAP